MSLYYGKKKIPNATVVGSPTINDGVVSGFSTGNYIALPNAFNPNSNTWEIVIKITTPSSISNSQVFFESTNGANVIRAVSIYIANATKTLSYCLTSNTSSYDIASDVRGSNVLDYSTTYYVKLIFDGTSYKSYISTDGVEWILDFSVTSSTKVFSGAECRLGYFAFNPDLCYQGSIDLNESYIKINGETWWSGIKYTSNKIRDNVSGVYIGAGKTNCLTHIPEDIKLELNNGVLTLKAGSKVYIPNGKDADGSNKFDEVVIETDITLQSGSNWYKGVYLLTYDLTNNAIGQAPLSESISGTVEPSNKSACFWYDTANNLVKEYKSSTLTNAKHSLPIAVTNNPNGSQFTTIDQVFNGFGYIGSTVFALPGVKGLIPNGRNADGSLKNIECVFSKVVTVTNTSQYSGDIAITTDYFDLAQGNVYNEKDNKNYLSDGVTYYGRCLAGKFVKGANGVITSLTPKTVKTTNDAVPIGVICKGSQVVYALPNLADIEKSSAGTYTFTPVVSGLYEITLVGGGAGGCFNSSSNRSSASSGSSGSACQVKAYLTGNKTYTVTVGGGGARNGWLDANTSGGAGGASTLKVDDTTLISATGGIGGTVWWPNGASASGQPAACTIGSNNNYFTLESVVFNTRGNSGGTGTHGGGASVYNGYGKGGSSTNAGSSSNASAGGTGYARIKLA